MKIVILDDDFDFSDSTLTRGDLAKLYEIRNINNNDNINTMTVLNFDFRVTFEPPNNSDSKTVEMFSYNYNNVEAWDDSAIYISYLRNFQEILTKNNVSFKFEFMISDDSKFTENGKLEARKYLINNDGLFVERINLASSNNFLKL